MRPRIFLAVRDAENPPRPSYTTMLPGQPTRKTFARSRKAPTAIDEFELQAPRRPGSCHPWSFRRT